MTKAQILEIVCYSYSLIRKKTNNKQVEKIIYDAEKRLYKDIVKAVNKIGN